MASLRTIVGQWLLVAVLPGILSAQSSSAGQNSPSGTEGVNTGGYVMHSSIEMGYRYTDRTGSNDMYDTLVNLQSGPRLLNETLSMQSLDHQGFLFDDLNLNSFGWGGDPNNALRLRADKNSGTTCKEVFAATRVFLTTICWLTRLTLGAPVHQFRH